MSKRAMTATLHNFGKERHGKTHSGTKPEHNTGLQQPARVGIMHGDAN
jgi:hypothetical protein